MKPSVAADEMFPDNAVNQYMDVSMEEMSGMDRSGILDTAGNEKIVHSDFPNNFGDLFDDEDLE